MERGARRTLEASGGTRGGPAALSRPVARCGLGGNVALELARRVVFTVESLGTNSR